MVEYRKCYMNRLCCQQLITYNMGTIPNMTNHEMEEMEIQGKMLRNISNIPPSTPYWVLLINVYEVNRI